MASKIVTRIDEVMREIRHALASACELANRGPDRRVKVVVSPDGTAYAAESVSVERGRDEHFGRKPHPLTVLDLKTQQWSEDADEMFEAYEEELRQKVEEWADGNLTVGD